MTSPHIKTHSMDTVADGIILYIVTHHPKLERQKKKKNYIEEEQLIL